MFRRIAVAATAITLTSFAFVGHAALSNAGKVSVKIDGVAKPGLGAFSGSSNDISIKEEGGKVVFTAEIDSPDHLKMGLRDGHTRECFKTKKHPKAVLTVDKSKLKLPEDNGKASGTVKGDLKLSGVTKPVDVSYTVSRTGSDYHVKKASFTFNYLDFGIEKICKLGVCVEPNVTVSVDKEFKVRDQ